MMKNTAEPTLPLYSKSVVVPFPDLASAERELLLQGWRINVLDHNQRTGQWILSLWFDDTLLEPKQTQLL